MAAHPDLDLAFSADPDLAAELLAAANPWADPLTGAEAWHARLEDWLVQLTAELPSHLQAPAYSLGLSLVGDAEIAALNTDWRNKDGPTDVLAFAAQDDNLDGAPPMPMPAAADGGAPLELGDIVISVDTAARQAAEHGHNLEQELLFLASHGLLHLLGWDHPDDASLAAMLARQDQLVNVPAEP
ncbi:rRNA maturation RNase YbeY [Cyanobium sp. Alchichica 3B3-8F6]|uniref:rRNA maturation RNase YbeY n=1 Tax=Cyanobium sp. Alchichica 3B3-8F6 TaxID=2823696 RepID=UPI0020CC235A|nr:rRNA maturation RNase YbeY [Cyanobium sp. Alchichica 3B3-8F6]MCP9882269.1 rRNA maturation RNase YbeY [Cyanobium sp. Alchichica 3B3-8F6]